VTCVPANAPRVRYEPVMIAGFQGGVHSLVGTGGAFFHGDHLLDKRATRH
jgi:hypothetical protein